jgi:hypothetical protein
MTTPIDGRRIKKTSCHREPSAEARCDRGRARSRARCRPRRRRRARPRPTTCARAGASRAESLERHDDDVVRQTRLDRLDRLDRSSHGRRGRRGCPSRGESLLELRDLGLDLVAVGRLGRDREVAAVEVQRLVDEPELPVALGDVVEEARVGPQLVGAPEGGDRLLSLAAVEEPLAARRLAFDLGVQGAGRGRRERSGGRAGRRRRGCRPEETERGRRRGRGRGRGRGRDVW